VSGSRALPPRWLPQCSCVVIESSFDPGERLQAPGSLWLFCSIALQSIKLRVTSLFYFVQLHCNLLNWSYLPFLFCAIALQSLNWSYLPFLFCVIALQSIKLELPPFLLYVIALQSIRLELPPFFYFA
jgi:hypothetical protein